MKKLFILVLVALIACTATALAADAVNVYVTISDDTGAVVLACAPVSVTDTDDDGMLTIADTLRIAHAENHENGLDAFGTDMTEYGLSMTKLWGVENGGAYGYYLNNASAWSLLDPVSEGSYVQAFAYTDLAIWSDTYCFFDSFTLTVPANTAVPLMLYSSAWDANYMPVSMAVAGAELTVDGTPSGVLTGEDGSAALTIAQPGTYMISATSEGMTMVPPVCLLMVTE